jgi:sugar lactone lactonase YvrE/mono/diheme cytochrome c family protein
MMPPRLLVAMTLPVVCLSAVSRAADDDVQFTQHVAPVLLQKCASCHGPEKSKGKYRLDSFERLMTPGDGGVAPVTAGKPAESELIRRITSRDPEKRMPQKDDPLPPEQVALIERWVQLGAKFDGPDRSAPLATLVPAAQQPHPAAPQVYPRPVPVLALAFSPDGREIAAGGYREVTVWDPADGKVLRRIGNVPRQAQGLAWSPDGATLAYAGGTPGSVGEVRLLPNAPTSQPSRLLDRIADVMLCVAFSPDGTKLAAGGADGAVRVYEVATGKRLLLIEQHADWVTAVAFSPDGTRLASSSRDKSARVFDARTGEMTAAYLGHEATVYAVAWSGDGRHVYSGGRDREVHAWEPAGDAKKAGETGGFGGDVLRLVPAGETLFACSADGKVRQVKRSDGKPGLQIARTFEGPAEWAYALALDPRSNRLAVGAFDGTVRIFSADNAKVLSTFVAAPGYSVRMPSAITPSSSSGG